MPNPKKTNFSYCYLPKQKTFVLYQNLILGFIYYKNYRLNILTNKKEKYNIQKFISKLSETPIGAEFEKPHLFHFSYEFGYLIHGLEKMLSEDQPLAIELKYQNYRLQKPKTFKAISQTQLTSKPHKKIYKEKFKRVYEHLLAGDCYQVNLTEIFKLTIKDSEKYFIKKMFIKRDSYPAYAHGSYLPLQKLGLMSFSPECLFHLQNGDGKMIKVSSMPIKGTKKRGRVADSKLWDDLIRDPKENAELNMITDLVRNDLAKIGGLQSTIKSIKTPLKLPGVLHQYSNIFTYVNKDKSLYDLLDALFPGGSITGAPKKNVMKIINNIETSSRRFYCGSTIILHKSLKKASINIRTAEFNFSNNEIEVGAGGGVTLQSLADDEFKELYSKFESVLSYLQ